MSRKVVFLSLLVIFMLGSKISYGQFKFGLTEMSAAVYTAAWGLPFMQVTPIHPGIEIGATFLENNKAKGKHSVSAYVSFFHHNVMANAPSIRVDYRYQIKIKEAVGIDLAGGVGYLHAFYPGEGYSLNKSTGEYESATVNKAFFTAGIGIGVSLIVSDKVQPFIRYDQTMLNNIYNQLSILKLGTVVRF